MSAVRSRNFLACHRIASQAVPTVSTIEESSEGARIAICCRCLILACFHGCAMAISGCEALSSRIKPSPADFDSPNIVARDLSRREIQYRSVNSCCLINRALLYATVDDRAAEFEESPICYITTSKLSAFSLTISSNRHVAVRSY